MLKEALQMMNIKEAREGVITNMKITLERDEIAGKETLTYDTNATDIYELFEVFYRLSIAWGYHHDSVLNGAKSLIELYGESEG
jgi:hypothetical protein